MATNPLRNLKQSSRFLSANSRHLRQVHVGRSGQLSPRAAVHVLGTVSAFALLSGHGAGLRAGLHLLDLGRHTCQHLGGSARGKERCPKFNTEFSKNQKFTDSQCRKFSRRNDIFSVHCSTLCPSPNWNFEPSLELGNESCRHLGYQSERNKNMANDPLHPLNGKFSCSDV